MFAQRRGGAQNGPIKISRKTQTHFDCLNPLKKTSAGGYLLRSTNLQIVRSREMQIHLSFRNFLTNKSQSH